jgi:GNAT superfamily N-acetyltransferase
MQPDRMNLRPCRPEDLKPTLAAINDAARAYEGIIPPDCWHEPYMNMQELEREIAAGVSFLCFVENGRIEGVMGRQFVRDVWLIRHAYVRMESQRKGIGRQLLKKLLEETGRPLLVGTWTAAAWAIEFYQKHGFKLLPPEDSARLLRAYWNIPDRQVETSVVLALGMGRRTAGR